MLSPQTSNLQTQCGSVLGSKLRWSKKYDVFVCHSSGDGDSEQAAQLVSFLEASPRCLRCFLQYRDECPGGAASTELCQALQDSHLWALLITPGFLQEDWCHYIMHQALAEGTMSSRIIPLLLNLSHSQYPQELKFFCCIDLSGNPGRGYRRISDTVLSCESKNMFTSLPYVWSNGIKKTVSVNYYDKYIVVHDSSTHSEVLKDTLYDFMKSIT